jgi:hypothetical protein
MLISIRQITEKNSIKNMTSKNKDTDKVSCLDCSNSVNGLGKLVVCYAKEDGSFIDSKEKIGYCKYFKNKK